MKASIELNKNVRSRDIQQFLNTSPGDDGKKVFIYNKKGKLFLTTDSSEASATGNSRKEVLASMKEWIKKSGYAGEVQALFRDIRNLALPLRAKAQQNLIEDQNSYLTLTSGQLTFLLKHRSDPRMLMSHASRGIIIDNSIRSLQKSLTKLSAHTANQSDGMPDKWQKEGKAVGEKLASSLMSHFQKEKPSASPVETAMFKISFFTNDIEAIKASIKSYCINELSCNITDEMLEAITSGLQESIANIRPLSIEEFSFEDADLLSLPQELGLDGEIYTLATPEYAGKGGHGVVHMYRNNSQPQKNIAVKSPVKCFSPLEISESNKVTQNELTTHLRAQGIGHENVVEVKGAFLVGSKLCIALEDCSLGKLDSFVTGKLIPHQDLANEEISLVLHTLARDVLSGLNFLHAESDIMHTDFKPQNVFVGADGKAKIGDFDRSASGKSATRDIHDVPDTAQYTPPSLLEKTREYSAKIKLINDKYDSQWIKEKDPAKRKEINKEKTREHKLVDSSVKLSQSDDVFSAGVTLYELYFGTNPFWQSDSNSSNALIVEQYGDMSDQKRSDFLFQGKKLAPGLEQQAGLIKELISGLMHPNPAKRLSLSDALESPIFYDSEVGSAEARSLIMQIGKGAPEEKI